METTTADAGGYKVHTALSSISSFYCYGCVLYLKRPFRRVLYVFFGIWFQLVCVCVGILSCLFALLSVCLLCYDSFLSCPSLAFHLFRFFFFASDICSHTRAHKETESAGWILFALEHSPFFSILSIKGCFAQTLASVWT